MTPEGRSRGTRLGRDLLVALLLTAAVIAATELWIGRSEAEVALSKETRAALYNALVSSGASLLGFAITGASIFLSVGLTARFNFLRDAGLFKDGGQILFEAIACLGGGTLVALACLVADVGQQPKMVAVYLMLAVVVICSVRVYRCVRFMQQVIRLASLPTASSPTSPSA